MTEEIKQVSQQLDPNLKLHKHTGLDSPKVNAEDIEGTTGLFYIGEDSRDALDGAGNQAITGVGFIPKFIRINATSDANADYGHSWGATTGTFATDTCAYSYYDGTNWFSNTATGGCVVVFHSDGVQNSQARILSFDKDGFTLYWTGMGVDVDFTYECFR